MILIYLKSLLAFLLVSLCTSASTFNYDSHFHQHHGSDLDSVQCHHAQFKISPDGGTPEFVNGQESKIEPSRQYLPLEDTRKNPKSKDEGFPEASFEQPKVLSVEKTLISPSLQNSYKSLFSKNSGPDALSPSAAQNDPSIVFPSVAPRVTSDKKHSHDDDENNLERLCNDAFHSFLCKPIKGPRKTPTGRLRPNAVIPPDVLAGLSSYQEERKVRPDNTRLPSSSNTVGQKYLPPSQPLPSNQIQRVEPLINNKPLSQKPSTAYLPPAPFENILKKERYEHFEIPSPSNTNSQTITTQQFKKENSNLPHHECNNSNHFPVPVIGSPSNDFSRFTAPQTPSTQKPVNKYFSNFPRTTFPTSPPTPYIYESLKSTTSPHDCEKTKPPFISIVANPSNDIPSFEQPSNILTQPYKPNTYAKSTTLRPDYSFSLFSKQSTTIPKHDCEKTKLHEPSFLANPTNENSAILKTSGFTTYTQPPPVRLSTSPNYFNPSKTAIKSTFPLKVDAHDHDCEKHQFHAFGFKTFERNASPKPYSQSTINPFLKATTESPKVPQPSDNIAQIIGQPQQINSVSVSPGLRGYVYEKPAIPFPPLDGSPTFENTNTAQLPIQEPSGTSGYRYDEPRIPFPSDNIAQLISQPAQQPYFKLALNGPTTSTPKAPCEHHKVESSAPVIGNPTNQDDVVLKPKSYVYEKPNIPFTVEGSGSSNQETARFVKPDSSSGYSYDKPTNPLLLPNPTNTFPSVVASPANNGYIYQKPEKQFLSPENLPTNNNQIFASPPKVTSTARSYTSTPRTNSGYSYQKPNIPFPSNLNSRISVSNDKKPNLIAKPQNQVEVTVNPGYSYSRPSTSFETAQSSNDNSNVGYSYPKPGRPFER